jgi:undecaprenyl-diphosphatase
MQVAAGVVSSLAVAVLSYHVLGGILEESTRSMDLRIMDVIYRWRSPTLTRAMMVATNLGAAYPIAALVLMMVPPAWRKRRREVLALAIIFIVGIILRPRPAISPLVEESGYSFPSGHAMNAFVFYSAVAFLCYRLMKRKALSLLVTLLAAGIVVLVGFSRVYLGVHYPSDVAGGYLVGVWWLAMALLISRSAALADVIGPRQRR